jgi:hypothetical protein
MTEMTLPHLIWIAGTYAVCRFDADTALPAWTTAPDRGLWSITRTDDEYSIIIDDNRVPHNAHAERGFVAMRIAGTLDFAITGVIAQLSAKLAAVHVPVFVVSTFDTDYLLVRAHDRETAAEALNVQPGPSS